MDGNPYDFTEDGAITFIDLLGFKFFLNEDINGAQIMMSDSLDVLKIKVMNFKQFPPQKYPTKELANLAVASSLSSFLLAYPISDSVILVSKTPDLFAVQTVHGVKGETHDVTLFVCPPSNEARCPSVVWWSTDEIHREEKRIAFVAMTRSRRDLIVCVTEECYDRLKKHRKEFVESFHSMKVDEFIQQYESILQ